MSGRARPPGAALTNSQPPHPSMTESVQRDESIAVATRAVEADIPEAEADPNRPVFHFRPPAGYHNDPNGLIWHEGYYHLFYQFHPFSHGRGKGGPIYWGHARSPDLVRWEHLPIALWPSAEVGEERCASGSAIIGPDGQPLIFYTSFDYRISPADAPDQWAAVGDNQLTVWSKHPANPIVTDAVHGSLRVSQWRDPFVFRDGSTHYMAIGGKVHRSEVGRAGVLLYRAEDDSLTRWRFVSVLYEWPDPAITSLECPSLFRFGERWLLFYSYHPPPTQVGYVTGTLDPASLALRPEHEGRLELAAMGMYAPQGVRDHRGRVVTFGWVRSAGWYPGGGRGWSGCMTLPRVLTLDERGRLRQQPAEELQSLRRPGRAWQDLTLDRATRVLDGVRGDTLEINAVFERGDAGSFGLIVRRSADGQRGVVIRCDGRELHVTGADPTGIFPGGQGGSAGADDRVRLDLPAETRATSLRVFIDKCVLEVFVDDRACLTRAIYSPAGDLGVAAFSDGGEVRVDSIEVWEMAGIW